MTHVEISWNSHIDDCRYIQPCSPAARDHKTTAKLADGAKIGPGGPLFGEDWHDGRRHVLIQKVVETILTGEERYKAAEEFKHSRHAHRAAASVLLCDNICNAYQHDGDKLAVHAEQAESDMAKLP